MTELRNIPEMAAFFAPRRIRVYQHLTLGRNVDLADAQRNAGLLNAALTNAAGGDLDLPAGAVMEVAGPLTLPGSIRLRGNGCTLVFRGALDTPTFLQVAAPDLTVDIDDLTLEGPDEATVLTAGNVTTRALACTSGTKLTASRLAFSGWFGNAVVGSVGADVLLEDCTLQAWHSAGHGGDGARSWRVRGCSFGRVGSGSNLDHHLYINPDVWLYLEGCEFLAPEPDPQGWSVHYYGSDETPPYRTPIFRDCLFQRAVLTNEIAYTEVLDCEFQGANLQVQNDTLIRGGRFVNADLRDRTASARHVRVVNHRAEDSRYTCAVTNPAGTIYQFQACDWQNVVVQNRVNKANTIDIRGGRWASGLLDLAGAEVTAHLDGGLHLGAAWATQLWTGATYTTGDVVLEP